MKTRFTLLLILLFSIAVNAQTFNVAWQKCFGGSANDKKPIAVARVDQSYTVGFSTASNNGDVSGFKGEYDWFVLKYDKDGAFVFGKLFGGAKTDELNSIDENSDKTYVAIGTTNSTEGNISGAKGGTDAWFMKLVAGGLFTWRKNVGGSADDEGVDAIEVENGDYLFAGTTKSTDGDFTTNAGGKDIFLVKSNLNGIFTWAKTYGGSLDDKAIGVAKLTDGYVVAAESISSNGPATNSNHGGKDILLIKVDFNGAVVWAKFFGGSGDDSPAHIFVLADGNILLTGTTSSNNGDVSGNHGATDIWVAKISTLGAIVWSKCYGGTADDTGVMAAEIPTVSKYYVLGTTSSTNGNITSPKGGKDIWIGRINTSGVYETSKNFGGTSDDSGTSVDVTFDKALLVAGETLSTNGDVSGNHGGGDVWVAKITAPTASFEPLNDFELTIAPNPARQQIKLNIPGDIFVTDITVHSITGVIVKSLSGLNNNPSGGIDISDLAAGHYFVTITAKQGIARQMIEVVK